MELNLTHELAGLRRLTPRELRTRYAEAFGEQPSTKNRGWLLKRLAWRLQSLAEGDLSQPPANVPPNWPTTPTCAPPRPARPPTRCRPSPSRQRRQPSGRRRTAACPPPAPS